MEGVDDDLVPTLDPAEGDTFFLEEVEIEDNGSDDGIIYNEVPEEMSGDSDDSEYQLKQVIADIKRGGSTESPPPETGYIPPVIDDFFRNFLLQNSFHETLKTFQTEYYERMAKNTAQGVDDSMIPDVYKENQIVGIQLEQIRKELHSSQEQVKQARSAWANLKKERDFHRLHHRRVVQEKNRLTTDMKRLRKHYASLEPTIKMLKEKYESTGKEKVMMKIQRDRLATQNESLEQRLAGRDNIRQEQKAMSTGEAIDSPTTKYRPSMPHQHKGDTPYPSDRVVGLKPPLGDPIPIETFTLKETFSGHSMAISDIHFHPRKDVVATVSDDRTWKLWSIPSGELIMSGEGHRDWIASCDIHPQGNLLATASGDGTVKIWDFVDASCRSTFSDHTQAVWGCSFHTFGDFLVSCSIDHSSKLWDLNTERCRHTFRGHVDSVNFVVFQHLSNSFATASGDKTVSLWDVRSGLCSQTFFGHTNAVNHVAFNATGELIVSSDADGVVNLWDIRTVNQCLQLPASTTGAKSMNRSIFDDHGVRVVSAGDDGLVRIRSSTTGDELGVLSGHEDSVQGIALCSTGKTLVSASSDITFRLWSL